MQELGRRTVSVAALSLVSGPLPSVEGDDDGIVHILGSTDLSFPDALLTLGRGMGRGLWHCFPGGFGKGRIYHSQQHSNPLRTKGSGFRSRFQRRDG